VSNLFPRVCISIAYCLFLLTLVDVFPSQIDQHFLRDNFLPIAVVTLVGKILILLRLCSSYSPALILDSDVSCPYWLSHVMSSLWLYSIKSIWESSFPLVSAVRPEPIIPVFWSAIIDNVRVVSIKNTTNKTSNATKRFWNVFHSFSFLTF